jgi:hypothetical protein
MNIPSSTVRDGDWKLYRFWFDGPGQTDRYELYNLKDDIGETKNLESAYPEKTATLSAELDRVRSASAALAVHPNKNYDGRTVGVWSANERGTATAAEGALAMRGDKEQFAAETRVTPSMVGGAVLEFEGRSAAGNHISVQWTSSSQPDYGQPQLARAELSKEWKMCRVEMPFEGRIGKIRFVLRDAKWQADLRNVRLLTPQGTLMTSYEFYP